MCIYIHIRKYIGIYKCIPYMYIYIYICMYTGPVGWGGGGGGGGGFESTPLTQDRWVLFVHPSYENILSLETGPLYK